MIGDPRNHVPCENHMGKYTPHMDVYDANGCDYEEK